MTKTKVSAIGYRTHRYCILVKLCHRVLNVTLALTLVQVICGSSYVGQFSDNCFGYIYISSLLILREISSNFQTLLRSSCQVIDKYLVVSEYNFSRGGCS